MQCRIINIPFEDEYYEASVIFGPQILQSVIVDIDEAFFKGKYHVFTVPF